MQFELIDNTDVNKYFIPKEQFLQSQQLPLNQWKELILQQASLMDTVEPEPKVKIKRKTRETGWVCWDVEVVPLSCSSCVSCGLCFGFVLFFCWLCFVCLIVFIFCS